LKYTGGPEYARDIAQETFIKVYEKRGDFDTEDKARSFLYITAKNKSLDYLKHQKVQQHYAQYITSVGEEFFFLQEVTYQETIRIVRKKQYGNSRDDAGIGQYRKDPEKESLQNTTHVIRHTLFEFISYIRCSRKAKSFINDR